MREQHELDDRIFGSIVLNLLPYSKHNVKHVFS